MRRFLLPILTLTTTLLSITAAQDPTGDQGYFGYSLEERDDADSVAYITNSTDTSSGNSTLPPDVYLNASVSVGVISLEVLNITARINLEAQVLSLLQFNAGVDVSIDRVSLLIENVLARVYLEARLENLVLMIGNVLDSIDLNPILVELGQSIGEIVNTTVGVITSPPGLEKRAFELENNVLYSVNDYSGNTHTNRILAQNGSIVDQALDNFGTVLNQYIVGDYSRDMTFNGYNQSVTGHGPATRELEYVYEPFVGLSVVSLIYTDDAGTVVKTQILAESRGGGSSEIAADL